MADALTLARFGLALVVAVCGAVQQGRLAFAALVLAAVTDFLDGPVARRHSPSPPGRHLDATADTALLASTAVALVMLHPTIVTEQGSVLAVAALAFAAGTTASWLGGQRLVDPSQLSAKAAGALLYAFALFTLATGVYEPALLALAAAALVLCSVETTWRAIATIHASRTARRHRSHAPHAVKGVARSSAARASSAAAAEPSTSEGRP